MRTSQWKCAAGTSHACARFRLDVVAVERLLRLEAWWLESVRVDAEGPAPQHLADIAMW